MGRDRPVDLMRAVRRKWTVRAHSRTEYEVSPHGLSATGGTLDISRRRRFKVSASSRGDDGLRIGRRSTRTRWFTPDKGASAFANVSGTRS